MTLDEAIKHAEEVAEEQGELCKRYDEASRHYRSYNEVFVSMFAKKSLECFECAEEHRQLAEWLKDYKRLLEQQPYDFAKWVASEIFDEWEYNKNSFAEIACRKLAKLGIVRAKGDEWELDEQEPTCDTCEYNKAAFNPCNACKDKSEYKPQADGEYISKSDMIDWLKDIRHKMKPQNYHTASEFEIAENQIWNLIQMLQMGAFPTVAIPSAEPKTGHWEWVQYDYNPKIGNWHCTECRCVAVECVDKNEKGGIPLYKYCPQCGAKMQESEE